MPLRSNERCAMENNFNSFDTGVFTGSSMTYCFVNGQSLPIGNYVEYYMLDRLRFAPPFG